MDKLDVRKRVVDDAERVDVAILVLDLACEDAVERLGLGLLEGLGDLIALHLVVDRTEHAALPIIGAHLEILNETGRASL